MREIKFRGKRDSDNVWVYGSLVVRQCDGKDRYYIYNSFYDELEISEYCSQADCMEPKDLVDMFIEVDPKTIGQLISKKDKSGIHLYEGDIIKYYYKNLGSLKEGPEGEYTKIGIIEYFETDEVFWIRDAEYDEEHDCFLNQQFNLIDMKSIEKIGNIHDNPEYLNKAK